MKKITFLSTAVSMAMLLTAVSCNEEEALDSIKENAPADNAVSVTFSAKGEQTENSIQKTAYKYNDQAALEAIVWQGNESFAIFPVGASEEEPCKFATSMDYADQETCKMTGDLNGKYSGYFGLYPYNAGIRYNDGKFTGVIIPAEQNVSEGQFDPTADILASYATDDDRTFQFHHAISRLGFTVPDDGVKEIKIATGADVYVAGTVDIALAGDAFAQPSVSITGNESNSVTLKCADGFQKGKTYYACIIPTSQKTSLTVTCTLQSGASITYNGNIAPMERGKRCMAVPPADKGVREKVKVSLSDLKKTGNFPLSSATKIVFGYLNKVDVSDLGSSTGNINGEIEFYSKGLDYYILSDKEICLTGSLEKMFYSYLSLTSIDFSNFNTDEVTVMKYMFNTCKALTDLDLSNFNTGKVTDMSRMFSNCTALTSLDLSNFNTKEVTTMSEMFRNCSALTSLDLSNLSNEKVNNMHSMFRSCEALTDLNVTNFNTANVTDMGSMFNNCNSLVSLDLSDFNTANVIDMSDMFNGCNSLTDLDVSNFNTAIVSDMSYMFKNCIALASLDLSSCNTESVTHMGYMFSECKALKTIYLPNFDTKNVEKMYFMFSSCSSLETIYASDKFVTTKVTAGYSMFAGCVKLIGGMGTRFESGCEDANYAHIDGGESNHGYFTDILQKP